MKPKKLRKQARDMIKSREPTRLKYVKPCLCAKGSGCSWHPAEPAKLANSLFIGGDLWK